MSRKRPAARKARKAAPSDQTSQDWARKAKAVGKRRATPRHVPPGLVASPTVVLAAASAILPGAPTRSPRMGPLLHETLSGLRAGGVTTGIARFVMDISSAETTADPLIPVSLSMPRIEPVPGERWAQYKQRVQDVLGPVREWMKANAGLHCEELLAGNGLAASGLAGQVQEATKDERIKIIELDPPRIVTAMDDAVRDIELPLFRLNHPGIDGRGVRVAVLDSGIDTKHPWLVVADSVSTCGEPVDVPGRHATHVAGSIASRDSVYRGVAPGVDLLNIKVLTSTGSGQPTFITLGIDAALDRHAHILSMSVGFNHLPSWSQGGHGWSCPGGDCVLCTAVNNAVTLEGVTVVVAAGNEHERATFLRDNNLGSSFDSEISCPGAARGAITVGALTKQTFLTAPFSSHGPTAFNLSKPDIAAPGVNISSSVPVPRLANGSPIASPTRAQLSARLSGTSMATPIVSGALALIIQKRLEEGLAIDAASLRQELLTKGKKLLTRPAVEVGVGRLSVGGL